MANYFDTGIQLTAGFSLSSQAPLDGRSVVELLTDLDAHIAENRAYEGMCVYVKENKKIYIYNGTTWEEFVGGGGGSSEEQIKDWVSGSSYLTGDYVYHEGEIYRCLTSNSDVDFDETNWKQLTYGIDELSKEDVEGLLGLTKEEIEAMASLISDTEVRIDKTYSSSKIHADIQQCLEDSKTYTLEELEKVKIDDTLTTTDKTVTGAINEVNGNLLDTVGFSADYKNIILNRKNGLNPYTIPISTIINNSSLAELKDVDSTDVGDGKILVYDGITDKHKYVDFSITDEFVKMDSTTDAKYLSDLIDKSTVVNDNGVLKVKKLDGQEVTITEINHLKGLTMNVMDLVNSFANGGVKVLNTPVATYADLTTLDRSVFIEGISYIVYVLADETHTGAKTTYLCDKTSSTYFGNADSQRNFTTNPIDLANEITGKLDNRHIDVDSLWSLLTIDDTYKTLTTTDNVFGTHGAKAMYDELVTEIGAKANATDLTTHTNDTDIHVTTADKTKWDKVTDLDSLKTEINTLKTALNKKADTDKVVKKIFIRDTSSSDARVLIQNHWSEFDIFEFYNVRLETSKWTWDAEIYAHTQEYGTVLLRTYGSDVPNVFYGKLYNGVWTWKELTTVDNAKDVGVTTITPVDSAITGTIEYTVKNGICYVSMKDLVSTISAIDLLISTTMPKPSVDCSAPSINTSGIIARIYIDKNTAKLKGSFYEKNGRSCCSFSYPVAE